MALSLALLPLLAAPAAPDWTVFDGPIGGPGDVLVLDDLGGADVPAGLDGVVLLPVDFVGRTRLERFLPDRPRREEVAGGAARLVLPGGHGSLYRYRRDGAGGAGGAAFGFFRVLPGGGAEPLFERAGAGPAAADDPFLPFVAASPDGAALLVGTTADAGGDVLEVEVATGVVTDRSAGEPPLALLPLGLGLRTDWGVALTADGPLRFARQPGAQVEAVALPGAPAWFGDGVVFSGDGLVAAAPAGVGPGRARLHTFGPTGPATAATMPQSELDGPGFLPFQLDGPYVALSGTGELVGYRAVEPKTDEPGLTREAYLARTTAAVAAEHLSADANFIDTIDEIGLLRFDIGDALLFGAGERNDEPLGGLDSVDVYRAVPVAPGQDGVGTIDNLSATSGDTRLPFESPGELSPEDGAWLVPGTDTVVLHDGEGIGRLVELAPVPGGLTTLLPDVKNLDDAVWTEAGLLVSIRREEPDFRQLVVRDGPQSASVLATLPDDVDFEPLRAGPGSRVAFVARLGVDEWLGRLNVATGTGGLITNQPGRFGPEVAVSATNQVRASLDPTLIPGLFVGWGPGSSLEVPLAPPSASFLLPAY